MHPANYIKIVCQWPRKQRRVAHKCDIYWYRKVANFSLLYIYLQLISALLLCISILKKIASAFLKILALKIVQFSSDFSSSHKITNIFKPC